jgi:hypothetical protein
MMEAIQAATTAPWPDRQSVVTPEHELAAGRNSHRQWSAANSRRRKIRDVMGRC